jgi:hypothetical protein
MIYLSRIQLFFICFALIFTSCKQNPFSKKGQDIEIAKIGNRVLYQSELSQLISDNTSKNDSIVIADGYIQNWIMEGLMIQEAEKNVAVDINIDKLVDQYRSSLLVDNYEKRIVETQLDTIVSQEELVSFYEANKSQYILSHPIYKFIASKASTKIKGLDNIERALNKSDLSEAMIMIKEKSVTHDLDTSTWRVIADIHSQIPTPMVSKFDFDTKRTYTYRDKDYQYYVKIHRMYHEKEVPPLSYIKDKIAKVILNERKTLLLKQLRKKLYDEGVRSKKIDLKTNS